jgi:stage II sporulation protein R
MQSKTLVWAYLLILSLGTILSLYIPKNEAMAKESVVIPGNAIRLRILANSDTPSDQQLKRDVRDAVNAKITLWVKDLTSLPKAKAVIHSKLPEIQGIAEKVVKDHHSNQTVHVKFGKVQFPTKLYGEFLYPAGEYQAILITLGKGEGANWWCVLYPPLCFLDFSNGVAVSTGFDDKQKVKSELDIKPKTTDEGPSVDPKMVYSADEEAPDQTAEVEQKPEESYDASKQEESVDSSYVAPKQEESVDSSYDAPKQEALTDEPAQVEVPKAKEAALDPSNTAPDQESSVASTGEQTAPVYTSEDEQPVKVKFFIVELWDKLFH